MKFQLLLLDLALILLSCSSKKQVSEEATTFSRVQTTTANSGVLLFNLSDTVVTFSPINRVFGGSPVDTATGLPATSRIRHAALRVQMADTTTTQASDSSVFSRSTVIPKRASTTWQPFPPWVRVAVPLLLFFILLLVSGLILLAFCFVK